MNKDLMREMNLSGHQHLRPWLMLSSGENARYIHAFRKVALHVSYHVTSFALFAPTQYDKSELVNMRRNTEDLLSRCAQRKTTFNSAIVDIVHLASHIWSNQPAAARRARHGAA